ncbi:hypothetical protein E2C01_005177 [Portunus trituberculatus]|uniref:Uncharacterized protein n=1 Tax=Portunus trituberculatus TaxID=210409 RepID=A0A5B7CTK0_PORTR|nr:hypothetical protein [Portunus trituberculatus]
MNEDKNTPRDTLNGKYSTHTNLLLTLQEERSVVKQQKKSGPKPDGLEAGRAETVMSGDKGRWWCRELMPTQTSQDGHICLDIYELMPLSFNCPLVAR